MSPTPGEFLNQLSRLRERAERAEQAVRDAEAAMPVVASTFDLAQAAYDDAADEGDEREIAKARAQLDNTRKRLVDAQMAVDRTAAALRGAKRRLVEAEIAAEDTLRASVKVLSEHASAAFAEVNARFLTQAQQLRATLLEALALRGAAGGPVDAGDDPMFVFTKPLDACLRETVIAPMDRVAMIPPEMIFHVTQLQDREGRVVTTGKKFADIAAGRAIVDALAREVRGIKGRQKTAA